MYLRKGVERLKQKFSPAPIVHFHANSYSQCGEDVVLKFLFNSLKIEKPSYIDIGANKPDWGNNTYLYYLRGAKGVCIEPDPALFKKFITVRPNDICLNQAVGFDEKTTADLFIFNEPSLNTLSREEAYRRERAGEFKLLQTITIPLVRLEKIIDTYFDSLPHFISLDVEGIDFDILQSFDFATYPIPVWIVETVDYSTNHVKEKNREIIRFMEEKGYMVYADTYINSVFVNKAWFHGPHH
jgi:FkbM family methyltransferase